MKMHTMDPKNPLQGAGAWSPTMVRFLYRHRNGRYYVRAFAAGKEKWNSLTTTLLSVARNRMKEHLDAAERQKLTGGATEASGTLEFAGALKSYRERLQVADLRPNAKAYRDAGIKLLLRSWEGMGALNVRRIPATSLQTPSPTRPAYPILFRKTDQHPRCATLIRAPVVCRS